MNFKRAAGYGCSVVLAIVLVIALIAWALSALPAPVPWKPEPPIPKDMPPVLGDDVPQIDINVKGRTADQLFDWSQPIANDTDMPGQALRAYANAELIAAKNWPDCHVKWNTIAGLGWVETRHGTHSGRKLSSSHIDDNGNVTPKIVGIPLDGTNGTEKVPDTDGGKFDGDSTWDRAIGPMQFIPSSWKQYGLDANGDGVADPNNIDDAALGAAHHLCLTGEDLSTADGWKAAILGYNNSNDYLVKVRDAANAYGIRSHP